jgi:hypothetical protein
MMANIRLKYSGHDVATNILGVPYEVGLQRLPISIW